MKEKIYRALLRVGKAVPLTRKAAYGKEIYSRSGTEDNYFVFMKNNYKKIKVVVNHGNKVQQISDLIDSLDITPVDSATFFYSIDINKIAPSDRGTGVFDNFTPNYNVAVNGYFNLSTQVVDALKKYVQKCYNTECLKKYRLQIDAINTIFYRPAENFFEALQRILFINQIVWQTGHKLVGLGHLDWLLWDVYKKDCNACSNFRIEAQRYIREFLVILHEYYRYKSNSLLGDTGQIIILGGLESKEIYKCNDLTYMFIEALQTIHLPDPKILVRYSANTPDRLLDSALECIKTGIGSPLLSNDDIIIPAMEKFGYNLQDAYNYGVSACWEPLVIGESFDNNNCATINFAIPFIKTLESDDFAKFESLENIISSYKIFLKDYIKDIVSNAYNRVYDEDPVLSLLSEHINGNIHQDFCRGDAKYNNTGFTSVGLACVVDSLLNIKKLVFLDKQYTLGELNSMRKNNFANEVVLKSLLESEKRFGYDDKYVIELTNDIMKFASGELANYKTKYDGKYKIGYSSPNYINGGKITPATFDGRKDGAPFATHISSSTALAYTELLTFASKLDYEGNRFNGNVVDFIASPYQIQENQNKFKLLLRTAFKLGVSQLQMNIVDSETLIAAKKNPEMFPNLIVRVWGFSAFFKDLPYEYQDVLIKRTLESEGKNQLFSS